MKSTDLDESRYVIHKAIIKRHRLYWAMLDEIAPETAEGGPPLILGRGVLHLEKQNER